MAKIKFLLFIPFSIILTNLSNFNLVAKAGLTSGADIYCVMRNGGNAHEPSWQAAYTNIKRQRSGIFKTSPKQAAYSIVEQVVSDQSKYGDCIEFLGDLYKINNKKIDTNKNLNTLNEKNRENEYIDRYSY